MRRSRATCAAIIIPRVHQGTAFNPPIAPVLHRLGFRDIREVAPWETQQLGDVEMILVPFHGEQYEPGAEIDHYTSVHRTQGLSLYGGVDAYRDSFADMEGVLKRVRDEYHPSVAFLPISRMMYRYQWGGVNAFCRYVDSTLLDKEFQYTAGPQEAAEWVRLLDVSTVVPYATFTFSRLATPPSLSEFEAALNQKGLGATLLPLRPLMRAGVDLVGIDRSAAMLAPMPSAASAVARVMAGPRDRFAVPGPRLWTRMAGVGGGGYLTPMSTTTTRAPAWRASTLMAAPPRAKLSSICPVTSCG
jgi:hypothetical protein